jgi:hypothetical protein
MEADKPALPVLDLRSTGKPIVIHSLFWSEETALDFDRRYQWPEDRRNHSIVRAQDSRERKSADDYRGE